ncbi:F420-dependent oxidoreductase family protein [Rhodococcus sp. MTM3W5.2]|uniref:TIGR03564 family F420-dependent LLM class oxidoreductase n=1 Tax=Rhodococcus sp. MTM3W5.2 TaxID=1805827 RepID=UPI000979662C|nr:TIGR03564 family F420-dependent LLM class oxidoreductase [Rhodococcus sp. MTM3W5.2]AQA24113.1 F420-dependent oxidoreductase family protein [Rhodococcus sp. MTM3W5.2]
MKIGIAIGDIRGTAPLAEVVGQVSTAADAGFTTAWAAQAFGMDALTTLAVAGGSVPGIGLGTAVVPTPQRHPLVLASHALTVQAATDNRLTLGIGAGIATMVDGMFGLPHDRPVHRMREYLSALDPLLHGETVSYQGETTRAVGAVTVPGAQPPTVLLAAMGPAMLRLAGELTDGTVTWMTGPNTLCDHIVPTVSAAARTAGRSAPRVVAGLPVCVTNDESAVRARIAAAFGLAGQVPEYRAVLDREGVAGPQDVAIVGDEGTVLREVQRLADAGVTEFMAAPFGTSQEQQRTIDLLAGSQP